ncbi:hypothetical protein BJX61DRAFT_517600 [Aspergillus egyptiacus]|nr:hypothetical protein BJX61DRAFT_517600 [Aspergillus egyptiacus]
MTPTGPRIDSTRFPTRTSTRFTRAGVLISLCKQSDRLRWLPEFTWRHLGTADEDVVLSDPLPLVVCSAHSAVPVLTKRAFIEALLHLRCRDIDSNPALDECWKQMQDSLVRDHEPYIERKSPFHSYWKAYRALPPPEVQHSPELLEQYFLERRDGALRKVRDRLQRRSVVTRLKGKFHMSCCTSQLRCRW